VSIATTWRHVKPGATVVVNGHRWLVLDATGGTFQLQSATLGERSGSPALDSPVMVADPGEDCPPATLEQAKALVASVLGGVEVGTKIPEPVSEPVAEPESEPEPATVRQVADRVTLHVGDCLDVLPTLATASVDAIVTDPPYELGFMGKHWDGSGIAYSVPLWRECLRVLKPGGHLLAFGGTRTFHRLAVAVEDTGFEIRDEVAVLLWAYGSGFPKSHNLKDDWQGWGTALKPAHEPVIVARKPLAGTVAANVLAHSTGALNIDGCRVEAPGGSPSVARRESAARSGVTPRGGAIMDDRTSAERYIEQRPGEVVGRWPANLVLCHHPVCGERCMPGCHVAELDAQSGTLTSGANPTRRGSDRDRTAFGEFAGQAVAHAPRGVDSGGASRFFPTFRYQAKAPTKERPKVDGVAHPTVKPVALIRWLVRLVTPPGGVVLDPFAGSGTTGQAATEEGFSAVLIEREPSYIPLIEKRLAS
jgi:site-specific DNA-methyltransferase (adenine-specific)